MEHDKTPEEIGGASSKTKDGWDFSADIGTEKTGYTGNVRFMQVRMRVDMKTTEDPQKIKLLMDEWVAFVEKLNGASKTKKAKVGNALLVSATFTSTDTTLRIVSSTLSSWIMSNLICLVSVLLFTQNIMISLYTMLAIVLIVATLLGVIFGIAQYPFGAIEAVGVTIFVGLSVDYCLHTAHGYSGSKSVTRKDKVMDMLTSLGISIAGAAVTTAGSCIFLWFCHIFLFVQLGVMLFANCLIAILFSLFFLSALLMIGGPLGKQGELLHTLTCKCCKKEEGAGAAGAAVAPAASSAGATKNEGAKPALTLEETQALEDKGARAWEI